MAEASFVTQLVGQVVHHGIIVLVVGDVIGDGDGHGFGQLIEEVAVAIGIPLNLGTDIVRSHDVMIDHPASKSRAYFGFF